MGSRLRIGMILLAILFATGLAAATPGYAAKLFVIPHDDSRGTPNPSGPVLRYEVAGPSSAPVHDATINDPSFVRPCCMAFSGSGELFVVNRGPDQFATGSITRFLDPQGTPAGNGLIQSSAFSGPAWPAFRGNVLYVPQQGGDNILRFLVSPGGATFDGVVASGFNQNARSAVVAPGGGELFVSSCCGDDRINRFRFGSSGDLIPNGTITGNGLSNPNELIFGPDGELFAANGSSADSVSRFRFTSTGAAVANGRITNPTLNEPITLAFSPWGELFVGNGHAPTVSRFTFNAAGAAVFNGVLGVPTFGRPNPGVVDVAFGPSGTPVPADAPAGFWRFGESSGHIAHDSAGTADGRYVGGIKLRQPGVFSDNTAAQFDGRDGHVVVPDSPALHSGNTFSLEVWLKRGKLSTDVGPEGLFLKGYQLYLDGNGQIVLRKPGSREITRSRTRITDTTGFHLVVATKSGNSVHLYIDGVDVTGPVTNATIGDTTGPLTIGGGAGTFRGTLDEAAVYDHVLSPARVAAHFAAAR